MKLEVLKCPSCGANIEFEENADSCECEYCGAIVKNTSKPTSKILENPIIPDVIKDISQLPIKKTKKKEPVVDKKGRVKRKVFDILSVICFVFAGFYALIFFMMLSEIEVAIMMIGMILFCAIFGGIFKVLTYTPKKSEYIYGKSKGIKTRAFVILSSFLAFAIFIIFVSLGANETPVEEPTPDSVVEEVNL